MPAPTDAPLHDTRVLIFAAPDFEDSELIYPKIRFTEAGAEVKVAGLGEKVYTGKKGYPVTVDANVEEVVVGHWDVVIVPGGWAPDKLRMNDAVLTIVKKAVDAGCVVAAICHGGWVLASADVINGKQVTSYRAIKDDMVNAGANWVDQAVVVDDGIITSRTPDDLPAFCKAIIAAASRVPMAV